MTIPGALQDLFIDREVQFELLDHSRADSCCTIANELGIDPAKIATVALLRDPRGLLMVVHSAQSKLDVEVLNQKLHRTFEVLDQAATLQALAICDIGISVPLAEAYGVSTIVEEKLKHNDFVYFRIAPQKLCCLSATDFCLLQGQVWYDNSFTTPLEDQSECNNGDHRIVVERRRWIRTRLEQVDQLPAMPTMAQTLLQLSINPYADAKNLAEAIDKDPSLTAQLIRYARSPLYGYAGNIKTVHDAITRVLGYDLTLDIALGIAVGRVFRNPHHGPLGLDAYWRHALYCGVLCERLGNCLPAELRPRSGLAYLSGLLHNIGFLLLGHLYPTEFAELSKQIQNHSDVSVVTLEQEVLGVTHMELGVWLMEAWDMPHEVVLAVGSHHKERLTGEDFVYPQLVKLSNHLLRSIGVGDEISDDPPAELLQSLKLTEDQALDAFQSLMDSYDGLDHFATQLAA